MAIQEIRILSSVRTPDDKQLFIIRRDLSGGVNSRLHGANIAENQATILYNIDIGVPGETKKRPGSVLIGNDVGANSVIALHNYEIQGGTDQLLMFEGTNLRKWTGSGDWSAALKSDFASSTDVGIISAKMSGITPDDIVIVQDGISNAFAFKSDSTPLDLGNTNTSPPITTVGCWYGNRVWYLKNDLLYFSSAYPSNYATAFDRTTNSFRVPVGEERALLATRDFGIIVMGKNGIWGIFPSATPAATDRPEPLLTDMGCVSKNGAVVAADDIYFFAQDGFRALKRTVQDKLQVGANYPISYPLKDEFARISWAYISRLSMEYFDNKIFIAVPTGASSFDTWVYYPAGNSFMIIQGLSPRCWAKYKISGEERLYYGKYGDGVVYRGWYGYTDEGTTTINGTAINYQEEGRKEDFGQPLIKKSGGIVKIKAYSSGNYDVSVYASIDDQSYISLGVINLAGNAPTLPINLPFDLADVNLIEKTFHLDSLGEFTQIRLKLQHNAVNASDDIKIFEREIVTYPLEFQDE